MTTAYIYVLKDPRDNSVRYVGKTNNPKLREGRHRAERGRTHKHYWVDQLRRLSLAPIFEIIETIDTSQWAEREIHWIQYFKDQGCNLTNATTGGEGAAGVIPSEETRRKISEALKRAHAEHPWVFPEAGKAKISALHKGRKRSLETRRRISEARKGWIPSAETRAKSSASRIGKPGHSFNADTRGKISVALSGERNGMSKLTMEKANEIRARYAAGGTSLTILGKEYGVDPKQIHRIVRNEAWVDKTTIHNEHPDALT